MSRPERRVVGGMLNKLETSAALPRDYEEFLFREPVVKRANAQINITRL